MSSQLKIGYTPYKPDYSGACDRRRFPFFARQRGLPFETYDPSKSYDLIVVTLNSDLSALSCRSDRSAKILFDLPDSYLSSNPWKPSNWIKGTQKYLSGQWSRWEWSFLKVVRKMCRRADAIACSTPEQKTALGRYNSKAHDILDFQSQEVDQQKVSFETHRPFRIVWEGVGDSLRGFVEAAEGLRSLAKELPLEIHLLTDLEFRPMNHYRKLRARQVLSEILPEIRFYLYEWNASMLSTVATHCDLAIIPVAAKDPMNRAKPENRLLLFWRMGVPALTSSTPAYDRVMKTAGLQATFATAQEWHQGLRSYALEPEKRKLNAEKGRRYINQYASDSILLDRWDQLFKDLQLT